MGLPLGRNCAVVEAVGGLEVRQVPRARRHPPRQRRLLLERPERGPERPLERVLLVLAQGIDAERVTDQAAEVKHVAVVELHQDAAAIGTGEGRRHSLGAGRIAARQRGPKLPVGWARNFLHRLHLLFHQNRKQLRQLDDAEAVIDGHPLHRVARHVADDRLVGILHDRQPAVPLDGLKASGAVVERAGEHHPDHARAQAARGRAEERVDGGPGAVLARAVHQRQGRAAHDQVPIGRRHVDPAFAHRLAVSRVPRRQSAPLLQHVGEHAPVARGDVKHHQDGRRQVRRQLGDEREQRLDAARRSPDDDHVALHAGQSRAGRREMSRGRRRGVGPCTRHADESPPPCSAPA